MSALDKAKNLAKKTNATIMVVNETTDEIFVVMSLDEYEKLTERQMTNDKQQMTNDRRQMTNDKQPTTNDQRQTTDDKRLTADSREQVVEKSAVVNHEPEVSLSALTEEELLAKLNEQIRAWRSAQVNREQIVLAEMPAEVKVASGANETVGKYNLTSKVDFRVDNLEEEEKFFLDSLD